jgi:benzoyl-CoA reductase/2-hydroxyglutaryl-CoA dehydratase subunit BcrC/BadD/HgdB
LRPDNLTNLASQVLSASTQVFQNTNKELINKLKKYETVHNQSLRADDLLWAAEDSSNKERTQELSQKSRQLREEENKLKIEINEMEVALYKKYLPNFLKKCSQV